MDKQKAQTHLEWAINCDDAAMVRVAARAGALLWTEGSSAKTWTSQHDPWVIAVQTGKRSALEAMIDLSMPRGLGGLKSSESIVGRACSLGRVDMAKALVAAGAPMAGMDVLFDMLSVMRRAGGREVKAKMGSGIFFPEIQSSWGMTWREWLMPSFEWLLGAQANVDAPSPRAWAVHKRVGLTLLMNAGNGSTAKLILEHGARTDTQDERGWTPLAHAIAAGERAWIKELVWAGAEVSSCVRGGHDAVSFARSCSGREWAGFFAVEAAREAIASSTANPDASISVKKMRL